MILISMPVATLHASSLWIVVQNIAGTSSCSQSTNVSLSGFPFVLQTCTFPRVFDQLFSLLFSSGGFARFVPTFPTTD